MSFETSGFLTDDQNSRASQESREQIRGAGELETRTVAFIALGAMEKFVEADWYAPIQAADQIKRDPEISDVDI